VNAVKKSHGKFDAVKNLGSSLRYVHFAVTPATSFSVDEG
jgi:hypothetical protein